MEAFWAERTGDGLAEVQEVFVITNRKEKAASKEVKWKDLLDEEKPIRPLEPERKEEEQS